MSKSIITQIFGAKARIIAVVLVFAITVPLITTSVKANDYDEIYFTIFSPMSTATLVYSISLETVSGVTNEMEYSINGTSWTGIRNDPLIVSSFIPAANATRDAMLYVRFKAIRGTGGNDSTAASEAAEIELPKRQPSPRSGDVFFDGLTETVAGLTSDMEYRIGTAGNYTPVPAGGIPFTVGSASQRIQVRMSAIALTASASAPLTIIVPARPSAPRAAYNGSTDTITGVRTGMSYSLDGGGTWIPCKGTAIPRDDDIVNDIIGFDGAATVEIKIAATPFTPESAVITVNVPGAPGAAPGGLTLDYSGDTELLTGVSTLMEYSINGTSWTAIRSSPFNVSSLIPSVSANGNVTLRIRSRAVIGPPAVAASQPEEIVLLKRPPTPRAEVSYNGADVTISGVTALMEYREGTTGPFTPATGTSIITTAGAVSKRYQIRVAADLIPDPPVPASAIQTITIPAQATAPNAVYIHATDTITGVSNAMEYRTGIIESDGSITWAPGWTACTAASIPRSAFAGADVVEVRLASTATRPASRSREISFDSRLPASAVPGNIAFNTFTEEITGVDDTMEYRVGTSGSFIAISAGETSISDATLAPETVVGTVTRMYQVRKAATSTEAASAHVSVAVSGRSAAPNAVYNGSSDSITGVTAAMEYRLFDGTAWSAWADCTGRTIPRNDASPDVATFGTAEAVEVRVRATNTRAASAVRTVSGIPGPPAPFPAVLSFDAITETVSGVSADMEYSTNGTVWRAISGNMLNGSLFNVTGLIPSATAASDVMLSIRVRAVGGIAPAAASASASVTLPKRQAPPRSLEVRFNGITETIDGITTGMEYLRVGTPGGFITGTGTAVPANIGASAQRIQVRMRATSAAPASGSLNITIQARASAPNAAYNSTTDLITGVASTMQFSTDDLSLGDAMVWHPCSGRTIPRGGAAPGSGFGGAVTVHVRTTPTATRAASAIRTITALPTMPPTPMPTGISFNTFTEEITGVNDTMEYRIGTSAGFTAVPAGETSIAVSVGTAVQIYQIRVKETTAPDPEAPASATRNISVPARAAMPSAAYNSSTDMITGVSTAREYSLDNGTTWVSCTGTAIPRDVFGNFAATVWVRTKATTTRPASLHRVVAVPDAPDVAPTGITLSNELEVVAGIDVDMEYSTNGTLWRPITSSMPLDVSGMYPSATASREAELRIRTRALSGEAASQALVILLPKRLPTPNSAEVRFDGFTEAITGITSDMEYRRGTEGPFTPGDGSPVINVLPPQGQSSQRFQVRRAGTAAAPASLVLNITISAQAAAPNVTYNGSIDAVSGTTTSMQYRLDSSSVWITCPPGRTIPIPDSGGALGRPTTITVRTAPTATRAASSPTTVTIPPAPGLGPGVVINP